MTVPQLWDDVAVLADRWKWTPDQVKSLDAAERRFYVVRLLEWERKRNKAPPKDTNDSGRGTRRR